VLTWYPCLLGYLEIIGNYCVNSFLLTLQSFMKDFVTSIGSLNGGHMLRLEIQISLVPLSMIFYVMFYVVIMSEGL
jgi:hypothetical protein